MKAWRVHQFGHYRDVMRFEDGVPDPKPPAGAAAVRVLAAGVNFSDILSIAGRYQVKAALPFTPGSELAGEVVASGERSRLKAGERVLAMSLTGSFAEYAVVSDRAAFTLPDDIDPVQAAAMLITYQTSHVALFRRAQLRAGEWLLVHGGAGGVGTAAIQLAKRAAARVIATAGGPEKLDVCRRCGADEAIDYQREDFVERVRKITDGRGADVIYDPVGGDVFDASIRCLAREGRLLVIGFSSGRIPEIKANRILLKNISLIGVEWPSYLEHGREALTEVQGDIWAGYRDGSLRPVISRVLPLSGVPEALAALESRESYGKIVIDVAG
jgi:NADPH2:quinone reductase